MELKDRKFINNTGKLPGFEDGLASQKQAGYPTYKEHVSPYQMMKENLNGGSFIGSDLDNKIQQGSGYVSDDPYVKNPNLEAPIKKQLKIGNMQTAAAALPGLVGSMYGAFTDYSSKNEYLAQYRPIQANIAGIGYQKMTNAKNGKLPGCASGAVGNIAGATASGAAMGSVAGPWGAAIGGAVGLVGSTIGEIFSASKDRENKEAAARYIRNVNSSNEGGALSLAMQIANAKQYGNQYDQSLWGHANGKIPGFENGLASATGPVNGEATARVSNGEVIANKWLGTMYRVPGLKNNKDGKLAALNNSDTVITNKYGLSDYAWRTGDIAGAEKMMQALTKPNYKCGKLPGHAEGWLGNGIPAMLGSIASLGQYIDAKNNRPYYPSTYSANPYETEALTTLAGLRINPFPITQQLRNAEARTKNAIDSAGGLSGGQRTAARLAALNTTQGNISKLLSDIQQQNNAYRANYAQAAINAGQQARQARMAANQWDLDYYSKAHAARNRGIQTGIANMLAQIQQYQANEFKRRQFNDTMDLYRADQKQRNEQNAWMRNWYASQNQPTRGIGLDPATQDSTTTSWSLDDYNRFQIGSALAGMPSLPLIKRRGR